MNQLDIVQKDIKMNQMDIVEGEMFQIEMIIKLYLVILLIILPFLTVGSVEETHYILFPAGWLISELKLRGDLFSNIVLIIHINLKYKRCA